MPATANGENDSIPALEYIQHFCEAFDSIILEIKITGNSKLFKLNPIQWQRHCNSMLYTTIPGAVMARSIPSVPIRTGSNIYLLFSRITQVISSVEHVGVLVVQGEGDDAQGEGDDKAHLHRHGREAQAPRLSSSWPPCFSNTWAIPKGQIRYRTIFSRTVKLY